MTLTETTTWQDVLDALPPHAPPLGGEERAEFEGIAKHLAADRSGAFLGNMKQLAMLACQLGAERDRARAQVQQLQERLAAIQHIARGDA